MYIGSAFRRKESRAILLKNHSGRWICECFKNLRRFIKWVRNASFVFRESITDHDQPSDRYMFWGGILKDVWTSLMQNKPDLKEVEVEKKIAQKV